MFGSRLVDTEVAEWQFDSFAWLIDNFSSAAGLPDSRLFLPIDEYFPGNDGQSTTQAEHFLGLQRPNAGLMKAIYLIWNPRQVVLNRPWVVWQWSKRRGKWLAEPINSSQVNMAKHERS